MIIGITGNSGTGKSEISKILAKIVNAEIIDADKIAKQLTESETEYYKEIIKLFGEEILIGKKLNRKRISEIVYSNKEKREKLNNLTFQYVVEEIIKKISKIKRKNIIVDAPLLFESGLNKRCNYTISVIANKKNKIDRICKRDNISKEIAEARINIQQEDTYYIQKSDFIIENNGNIEQINWEEICTRIGKT